MSQYIYIIQTKEKCVFYLTYNYNIVNVSIARESYKDLFISELTREIISNNPEIFLSDLKDHS